MKTATKFYLAAKQKSTAAALVASGLMLSTAARADDAAIDAAVSAAYTSAIAKIGTYGVGLIGVAVAATGLAIGIAYLRKARSAAK